jgi:heme/copper-type cytochrome/quinol oxidase subunit 2
MKKTVFRYGMYATILIVTVSAFNFFLLSKLTGEAGQEVAGYLTMLLSMIFVFIGIRHYRDYENGGRLSFGEGLKVGVLIVLIPSVFFGLFDLLYTEVINPNWLEEYYTKYADKLKASTAPEKLDAALKKLSAEKEIFSNPIYQFLLMAVTVFIIGFIVTIISSITLKKSRKEG